MSLPTLTPEQRADALLKAAAARVKRSEVKTSLKRGTVTLSEVIKQGTTDDIIGKIKVTALSRPCPASARSGPARSWTGWTSPRTAASGASATGSARRSRPSSLPFPRTPVPQGARASAVRPAGYG